MNQSIGISHLGQKSVNEDSILTNDELGLYIVADGVGSMKNGHIGSAMACNCIQQSFFDGLSLISSIELCHSQLQMYAKNNFKENIATTIAAVIIQNNKFNIAWVGSSRVYLWDGQLKLLTRDDSFVESLLQYNIITLEQSRCHSDKKTITQALGMDSNHLYVHSNEGYLEDHQYLLLTTDGFHQIIQEKSIIQVINAQQNFHKISEELFYLANKGEVKDDMSFILIEGEKAIVDLGETCPDIVRTF